MESIARKHPEFLTVTCLEWKHLLAGDHMKQLIVDSLAFLSRDGRIIVYGFVIMVNHFHVIWQMKGEHNREEVQRDFLKYAGQQILKHLRNEKSSQLDKLMVNAKDRKHQVWERNSLGIALWSTKAIWGKLEYIHNNPVQAGLCEYPWEYTYSSAGFYLKKDTTWNFLIHIDG